jgi:hypothetical protein
VNDWALCEHDILAKDCNVCLEEAMAALGSPIEGHKSPCYYCKEPCDALAGNPGLWPIPLCHADEPGVVKWHHIGCVSDRLREYDRIVREVDGAEERAERQRNRAKQAEIDRDAAHAQISVLRGFLRDVWKNYDGLSCPGCGGAYDGQRYTYNHTADCGLIAAADIES